MKTIDGLENIVISNYYIRRDSIELVGCGTITTIKNTNEVETIKAWIKEAKRWLPDDSARKYRICNYLEYMLTDGQYE